MTSVLDLVDMFPRSCRKRKEFGSFRSPPVVEKIEPERVVTCQPAPSPANCFRNTEIEDEHVNPENRNLDP